MTRLSSLQEKILLNLVVSVGSSLSNKDVFEKDPYYRGPDPEQDPRASTKRPKTHPTSPRKHNTR